MIEAYLRTSLLLIILATQYVPCSEAHVLIKPTDNDPPACGYGAGTCHTLSYYLSTNPSIFNESNSAFEFLPGTHRVKGDGIQQLTVQGVHSITWYGHGANITNIVCERPTAFIFANTEQLQITDLQFSNCGYVLANSTRTSDSIHVQLENQVLNEISATLGLVYVTNIQISRVSIYHSRGYGLFGLNLWGKIRVDSSLFQGNGRKCNENDQPDSDCLGGNVALYFFRRRPRTGSTTVSVSILRSSFYDGKDQSNWEEFSCNKLREQFASPRLIPASGLAVITGQQEYRVQLCIDDSKFMRNDNLSAVLIHDQSGVTNNTFRVINSHFENEGKVTISSIDNPKCSKNKFCYKVDQGNRQLLHYITIENCTFSSGNNIHTGLEICVKPQHVLYRRFQTIAIKRCSFWHYSFGEEKIPTPSIININYNYSGEKYPRVLIEIDSSTFTQNQIPSLIAHLGQDTYSEAYQLTYYCPPILTLKNTHFLDNRNLKLRTILIEASEIEPIPIWKYNTTNKHEMNMSRVGISNCIFTKNTAQLSHDVLRVERVYFTLDNCSFSSSVGTPLYALSSVAIIKRFNLFVGNTGKFGGAIHVNGSRLYLMPNSSMLIINNTAHYGGGIFAIAEPKPKVGKTKTVIYNYCTISRHKNTSTEKIELQNNRATYAGDSIYGGTYNNCLHKLVIKNFRVITFSEPFPSYVHILHVSESDKPHNSDISSPPTKLCTCEPNSHNYQCNDSVLWKGFPGQKLTIPLIALGELNGTTPAVVRAEICDCIEYSQPPMANEYRSDIGYAQQVQVLARQCTYVNYTVHSLSPREVIEVTIDKEGFTPITSSKNRIKKLHINVSLSSCPDGFEILPKPGEPPACECREYFKELEVRCNVSAGEVIVSGDMWINNHTHSKLIHGHCPFDYCNSSYKSFKLNTPDEQCGHSRSGVLCGACQTNLSVVLGTSNCKKCSNLFLLLLIPFTLAGLVLVVLLLKCNLTVSTGHINGIIFYANIVQVNKELLLPNQETAYRIFSTFVAWLNLDLGFETCFFDNMDTYAKVWLQFVFPIYLWILIALVIISANYSTRAGRLIGSNSVPVLATLFLLSYAKLLRTIIASVSFTFITYEDGSYLTVWLQDGNVEYLSPKHAALFCAALLFTIGYILPLTVLALFAPCLQARSHHKALKWVNRLKPFLDAYQGPYSDNFRYWTGLLLILRVLLFIIFAANYENDPSMSFFWSIMIIGPIAMICLIKQSVYRHKTANLLETVSLLNIVIVCAVNWLTTTTGYEKWHPIREYATYTSMVLTVLVFLVILLLQPAQKLWAHIYSNRVKQKSQQDGPVVQEMDERAPTVSVVELDQSDNLREPLLDTN